MKMKEKTITIKIYEYATDHDLPQQDMELLHLAREASNAAYAPYSGFYVGAAVLLESGKIFTGNNQENSAYPSGLCAERVAIFAASSQCPNEPIKTIAVTAHTDKFTITAPISPCGACRQVMAEYQNKQNNKIRIILAGKSGSVQVLDGVDSLLPLMFHEDNLKNH